jgi:hypothetical protein
LEEADEVEDDQEKMPLVLAARADGKRKLVFVVSACYSYFGIKPRTAFENVCARVTTEEKRSLITRRLFGQKSPANPRQMHSFHNR